MADQESRKQKTQRTDQARGAGRAENACQHVHTQSGQREMQGIQQCNRRVDAQKAQPPKRRIEDQRAERRQRVAAGGVGIPERQAPLFQLMFDQCKQRIIQDEHVAAEGRGTVPEAR